MFRCSHLTYVKGGQIFPEIYEPTQNPRATEGRQEVHIEKPQILCATVQSSVATATYRPGFVQPWRMYQYLPFAKKKITLHIGIRLDETGLIVKKNYTRQINISANTVSC
jgi:hypothetical protein